VSINKTIRLRTQPDGSDRYINFNVDQDFDFIEILSLKLSQKDLYPTFCADYGVIVGRVFCNRGLGVENAKVSVFIPIDALDSQNDRIFGLYPYETITSLNSDGVRYNLLPSRNNTNNECFTPVGTFPEKRQFLDNDDLLNLYCKYYKFTTTTNHAGDFMLFGVPTGTHIMNVEADLSDIGVISQRPSDLIEQGSSTANFDSTSKFKSDNNLNKLNQVINRSAISVTVYPFWGDEERCNASISRMDVDLNVTITPNAVFMGSIFGDNESDAIGYRCRPSKDVGRLERQHALPGKIEMIRKTVSGSIERFDIKGGQLIDQDGTWAYQVPMNLDYVITDEFGNLTPTYDTDRGIPTRAKVRFRITMDGEGGGTSSDAFRRGSYLIPHNPVDFNPQGGGNGPFIDFSFGSETYDSSFATFEWNTVYSIKSFIPRYEHVKKLTDPLGVMSFDPSRNSQIRTFVGIKDVDGGGGRITPFPYNRLNIASDGMFNFICGLYQFIAIIIAMINGLIVPIINGLIDVINAFGADVAYMACITVGCNIDSEEKVFAPGCDFGSDGCNAIEAGNVYCVDQPGMNNSIGETLPPGDAGFTQCVALSLIESMSLLEFDFYNDWINGTLYAPLFAMRGKLADSQGNPSTNESYFCEAACDGLGFGFDNLPDALGNSCYDGVYLKDTCIRNISPDIPICGGSSNSDECGKIKILPPPLNGLIGGSEPLLPFETPYNRRGIRNTGIPNVHINNIKSGLISYRDEHYYYTPNTFFGDFKLFATDIVTLGSTVKCHWKGLPYVANIFVETTYKRPPFLALRDVNPDPNAPLDLTPIPILSGMDSLSASVDDSLFFLINCFFFTSKGVQCGNIKRQCELGVGFDSRRYDNTTQSWPPPPPGTDPTMDVQITPDEIDLRLTRKVFAWMNSPSLNQQYPFSPLSVNVDFDQTPTCGAVLGEPDYNTFIYGTEYDSGGNIIDAGTLCSPFPKTDNSFYFYFGLNRNKTALKKFVDKYMAPCPILESNDFVVIANIVGNTDTTNPNGIITITVQGASEPITYVLTYPDGSQDVITDGTSTQIFTELNGGTYTLTVTDSVGATSTTVYNVSNPTPLTCTYTSSGISSGNQSDGIINAFVNGGTTPYTITLTGPQPYNATFSANTHTIPYLPFGDYIVTITDDEGDTCSQTVTIDNIPDLYFTVNALPPLTGSTTDITSYDHIPLSDYTNCAGTLTGKLNVRVFGGEAPYQIQVRDSSNIVVASASGVFGIENFTGLNNGVYFIEVTDVNNTSAIGVGTNTTPHINGSRLTEVGGLYQYIIYDPSIIQIGHQLLGAGSVRIVINTSVTAWPWPDVTFGYSTASFTIYDSNGNLVPGYAITNHPGNEYTFTNLPSGNYTARVGIGFCTSNTISFTIT